MRALSLQLGYGVLAALLYGCAAPRGVQTKAWEESPAFVIYQYPDYPPAGRDSAFPGGLVAALWREGRMIRPVSPSAIGKSYVAGVVSQEHRDAFFSFLSAGPAVHAPQGAGVPVDVAAQSITLRQDGTTSKWTRVLPDEATVWGEVESRLFKLSLQERHLVDLEAIRSSRWYE